jgi:hypothetical protein
MAIRRFQAALSPALIATITAAEQSFVVGSGDLQTSSAVIVTKPTTQAGLIMGTGRVVDATHVAIVFANPTVASITPTAGEVYQFTVID